MDNKELIVKFIMELCDSNPMLGGEDRTFTLTDILRILYSIDENLLPNKINNIDYRNYFKYEREKENMIYKLKRLEREMENIKG